jgi:hypothetical protein
MALGYYLPPFETVTFQFLRQILAGKKKVSLIK